ncbi:MAG: tetratricopeptide repeat protein [Syntrophobacteraceae bacterium]
MGEGKETTQLIDELKSLDATSDIPLIAITNDGDLKNVMRIMAKGVDEVIVTPLSKKTVENVALKILQTRSGADPVKNRLDSAKELIAAGQFEAAREVYLELLSQDESLLEAHLGISEVNCLTEQWKDAQLHLKKALELAKSATSGLETQIQLAEVFFHYGSFYNRRNVVDKATKCFQTSASLNPFHTGSIMALLELLQMLNEENEIIKVVGEARANFLPYSRPMDEVAFCLANMAEKFTGLNMTAQARNLYDQIMQLPHGNVDVHLKVADFFLEEGLVSQVLERLVNLLKKLKDADILFKTGSIFLDLEKRYLSSSNVNAAEGVDLSFFEGLDSGTVLTMAERMFQEGLFLEPESPRFSLSLTRCFIRQAKAEAASEILAKLKERYTEDIQRLEEVIDILLSEGAYDHAHTWIKDAIKLFPQEISFYALLARYHKEQKRPYDAIGCLKRSLSINPSHVESMIALAELYEEIREFSDAILYYEKAAKFMPDDKKLQEKLERVLKLKYSK